MIISLQRSLSVAGSLVNVQRTPPGHKGCGAATTPETQTRATTQQPAAEAPSQDGSQTTAGKLE